MANIRILYCSLLFCTIATIAATVPTASDNGPPDIYETRFLQGSGADILVTYEFEVMDREFIVSDGLFVLGGGENPENPFIFDPHSVKRNQIGHNLNPIKSPFRRPRDGIRYS